MTSHSRKAAGDKTLKSMHGGQGRRSAPSSPAALEKPLLDKGYPENWTKGTRVYKEIDVVAAVKKLKGKMCCGHHYDKTCTCWTCKDIDEIFGKVE